MFLRILQLICFPFSWLYRLVTDFRNYLYDRGIIRSARFDIPVISVGNLSVGGTGKTPHVEYLIRLLYKDYKVATLSRGYKRKTRGFVLAGETVTAREIGDEPMQFHVKFPSIAVAVSEDRLTGIPQLLLHKRDIQAILLDDAFQHRRVKPGLQILLTEYNRPFYEDFVLPAGRLRESRKGYRRADIIVVTKCPPDLSLERAEAIRRKAAPLENQQVFFSAVSYGKAYDIFTKETVSSDRQAVLLVAGIARPGSLLDYAKDQAAAVIPKIYPDHHSYIREDLEQIRAMASGNNIHRILTTEKDAVKLFPFEETFKEWGVQVVALPVEMVFLFNEADKFNACVREYLTAALAHYERS